MKGGLDAAMGLLNTLIGLTEQDKAGSERMRFFKHGAVLAISLPESLRQKLGITENDEYDFVEMQPGVLALVKKGQNATAIKTASNVLTPGLTRPSSPPTGSKPALTATPPSSSLTRPSAAPGSTKPAGTSIYGSTGTVMDRQGFLVLSTEEEAKNFSHRFENLIKAGEIKGVRGFDKKFYLAARAYSEAFADNLLVSLKESHTASELASMVKQPLEGVLTLLYLLKEEGEVIEKKRGLFVRVI